LIKLCHIANMFLSYLNASVQDNGRQRVAGLLENTHIT
jgi:hypothetical protein